MHAHMLISLLHLYNVGMVLGEMSYEMRVLMKRVWVQTSPRTRCNFGGRVTVIGIVVCA